MGNQSSVQVVKDTFQCYDVECSEEDIFDVLQAYADRRGSATLVSLAVIAVKARNPAARISDAVIANYIGRKGTPCLRCKSEKVECGQIEVNDAGAAQDCWCNECGLQWMDIYTLTGVEEEN